MANDYDVATNEATAVDQRNSFPYRAKAQTLGDPTLHPNMPVYLDGLGSDYSGFWIVLKAKHVIESNSYNSFVYTTNLTVGTDSLGEAARGKDNKKVTSPNTKGKRNIVNNVRQTNKKPKSSLKQGTQYPGANAPVGFGEIKNRTKPVTANRTIVAKKWVNTSGNLRKVQEVSSRPAIVVKKLRRTGAL